MKRFMSLILFLVMAVFVLPAHADPIPKEVEVVNAADNAVPVQGDVQVTNTVDVNVTNAAGNPIPVTVSNPSTGNATIKGIARQDGEVLNLEASQTYTLISLAGPKTLVTARVQAVGANSEYTTIELVIDGEIIVNENYVELAQKGWGNVGNFGLYIQQGSIFIGFPLPVSFDSSLVINATPTYAHESIKATVIYGQ